MRLPAPALLIVALSMLFASLAPAPLAAGESYECLLEPWKVVRLGARSTGVLERLGVDRGDEVEAGQEVASLNSEVERAALALAEARAASTARIELAEARAELERIALERNETLFRRKVISSQQMDEARASYRIASLQVAEAQDERRLAELEERRARAIFDLKTIRTPISGIVVSVERTAGEYLSEGEPVAVIAQIDPIRAEAFLPLEALALVRPGDRVTVRPRPPVGGVYRGVVDVVDRVVEARSGTVGVRVRIDNPEKRTLAGVRCDLELGG